MAASADLRGLGDSFSKSSIHDFISTGSFNSSSSGQWQRYLSDYSPISSKQIWKERDPVSIERSNLVNICKLVVKELIESSLKSGRQLDSDSVPLQHFFIVLEHVLRHGLKPKRGILGPKKELWDLFQMVERWSIEAQDITASVRDLPTVNTALGRARAWLRLALMQKKLSDYFRLLLERRDELLVDFYEQGSLMLADESVVIMGLLVGLNVVDCNLCVKEEDLDSQMGVIDFSLYLRKGPACTPGGLGSFNDATNNSGHSTNLPPVSASDQDNLTTVLDQKNYIEELNRHLNATVSNLQARVESLTATNTLMKEDLSIARTTIVQMQDENDSLRQDRGIPTHSQQIVRDREAKKAARISVIGCEEELQDLKRQLEEESAHTKQVERELELQIQMKAESEMAAKLLEKDIHEKQDTIVSLRRQLEDIKIINLEMYTKLQECEVEISDKGVIVERLQEKTVKISTMLMALETNGFLDSIPNNYSSQQNYNNSSHSKVPDKKNSHKRASLKASYKVSGIDFNWEKQKLVYDAAKDSVDGETSGEKCDREFRNDHESKSSGEVKDQEKNDEEKVQNSSGENSDPKSSGKTEELSSTGENNGQKFSGDEKDQKSSSEEKEQKSTSEEKEQKSSIEEKEPKSTSEEKEQKFSSEEKVLKSTSEEKEQKSSSEEKVLKSTSEEKVLKSTSEEKENKSIVDDVDLKCSKAISVDKISDENPICKNSEEKSVDSDGQLVSDQSDKESTKQEDESERDMNELSSMPENVENKIAEALETLDSRSDDCVQVKETLNDSEVVSENVEH